MDWGIADRSFRKCLTVFERADEHGLEGLAGGLTFHVTGKLITGAVDNFDEFSDVRRDRRPVLREKLGGRFMYIPDICLLVPPHYIDVVFMVPYCYAMGQLHLADRGTGRATSEPCKVQEDKEHRFELVP